MVETERERLVREGRKPRHKHDASLWSRIMQTSEDEVLSIIDRALFDRGWDVFALIFDGLIGRGRSRGRPEPSQRPPAVWLHGDAEVLEDEGGARLRLSLVLPAGALNASRHEALLKCEAAAVPGRRCPRAITLTLTLPLILNLTLTLDLTLTLILTLTLTLTPTPTPTLTLTPTLNSNQGDRCKAAMAVTVFPSRTAGCPPPRSASRAAALDCASPSSPLPSAQASRALLLRARARVRASWLGLGLA